MTIRLANKSGMLCKRFSATTAAAVAVCFANLVHAQESPSANAGTLSGSSVTNAHSSVVADEGQGKAQAGGDTHGEAATASAPEVQAEVAPSAAAGTNEAKSLLELFTKGHFSGNFRTIYFSSRNAFFTPGMNQDTASYGGKLGFTTASLYGFSVGVSGFVQRSMAHSDNPEYVNSYLGPNITAIGETYLQYEDHGFKIVGWQPAIRCSICIRL